MNCTFSASAYHELPGFPADPDPDPQIWSPLDLLAGQSAGLAKWRSLALEGHSVPSYVFIGPRCGQVPMRLAILAGIENEDSVGTIAIVKLLLELNIAPPLAQDFAVFAYPSANPPRVSRYLPDFTADFWKCAGDPVIRFFERELTENQLDGIIAIKAGEPIAGLQIHASSRMIAAEVLWPSLEIAQRVIPLASEPIQVFPNRQNERHSLFSLGCAQPGPFTRRNIFRLRTRSRRLSSR
jgi:hypothetical protein